MRVRWLQICVASLGHDPSETLLTNRVKGFDQVCNHHIEITVLFPALFLCFASSKSHVRCSVSQAKAMLMLWNDVIGDVEESGKQDTSQNLPSNGKKQDTMMVVAECLIIFICMYGQLKHPWSLEAWSSAPRCWRAAWAFQMFDNHYVYRLLAVFYLSQAPFLVTVVGWLFLSQ